MSQLTTLLPKFTNSCSNGISGTLRSRRCYRYKKLININNTLTKLAHWYLYTITFDGLLQWKCLVIIHLRTVIKQLSFKKHFFIIFLINTLNFGSAIFFCKFEMKFDNFAIAKIIVVFRILIMIISFGTSTGNLKLRLLILNRSMSII